MYDLIAWSGYGGNEITRAKRRSNPELNILVKYSIVMSELSYKWYQLKHNSNANNL
jgi:hypothetical protein